MSNATKNILRTLALLVTPLSCSSSETVDATGEFGLSGVSTVYGTVLDRLDQPLDSVRISANVPDNSALYVVESAVTSRSGGFSVKLERRGSRPTADSIAAQVTATSLRGKDKDAEGRNLVVRVPIWLQFGLESAPTSSTRLDVSVPVLK